MCAQCKLQLQFHENIPSWHVIVTLNMKVDLQYVRDFFAFHVNLVKIVFYIVRNEVYV